MLTGDKQETAINIAYSCGLFHVPCAFRNHDELMLCVTLVAELHGVPYC